MKNAYKSFAFICFSLSVVTKEIVTNVAPNNSIELFDNILYQRFDNVDDDVKDIYFAWSIIKKLITVNRTFLYKPYKEVLENILYDDTEYELVENFNRDLLQDLCIIIKNNKEILKSFYKMGTDKLLYELISK